MANTITTNGKPGKHASPFAGRKIRNYRRPLGQWFFHPALRDGRFSRRDVPAMLQDNAVSIGLYTIYGPLFGAKWEVRANSREIKTFVENTLYRFWHHDLMRVLQHYVTTGTAVAEVMYEQDSDTGLWHYAGLDDFDMNDVQALRRGRHLTGARVSYGGTAMVGSYSQSPASDTSSGSGHDLREWNVIRHPKIFWCAHRPLCGELFGRSALEPSWNPWMEKVGSHGAISIRKLWAFSNAFRGCLVKYPPGSTQKADGTTVDNQDIAREMAEAYCTGAAIFCPSGTDENGKPLWEIVDPALNGEIRGLMEYPADLDRAVWQGMGVLDEVIHASDTGGSWSGRSGPLLIFLNISDMRMRELITAFDVGPSGYTTRNEQAGGVIRSLVMENFGPKARYEIRPYSLVPNPQASPGASSASAPGGAGGQQKSAMGQGPAANGAGKPPKPAGQQPVKLSQADQGVELPDAKVAAILASGVLLSATSDEPYAHANSHGIQVVHRGEIVKFLPLDPGCNVSDVYREANRLVEEIRLSSTIDATGHAHKGKGEEGGGQFTSKEGGSGPASDILAKTQAKTKAKPGERESSFRDKYHALLAEAQAAHRAAIKEIARDAANALKRVSKLGNGIADAAFALDYDEDDDSQEPYGDLIALISDELSDDESPAIRYELFKRIETHAEEAMKVKQPSHDSGATANQKRLRAIISNAQEARKHLKEHVSFRKELKALKKGLPENIRLSMAEDAEGQSHRVMAIEPSNLDDVGNPEHDGADIAAQLAILHGSKNAASILAAAQQILAEHADDAAKLVGQWLSQASEALGPLNARQQRGGAELAHHLTATYGIENATAILAASERFLMHTMTQDEIDTAARGLVAQLLKEARQSLGHADTVALSHFDEAKHPRGHEGNPGQFAPKGQGGHSSGDKASPKAERPAPEKTQAKQGPDAKPAADPTGSIKTSLHPIRDEQKTPPPPGGYKPNPAHDPNGDGIADAARVGVPAMDVPPPPPIPRLPNLTTHERTVEYHFAKAFETNPDKVAGDFLSLVMKGTKPGEAPTFGTDDAKVLTDVWSVQDQAARAQNRATLNTPLHQTANAIAKKAFLKHLDTLKKGDEVLVTVGGCGAGKGYALKNVPKALEVKGRSKAVWDSAGDQNASENPWIQAEAEKRGLKVNYVYVHADPKTQWAHPERGVIKRAADPSDGRMVGAMVFADSYALGAKNMQAFYERNQNNPNANFTFLENAGKPRELPGIPEESLKIDPKELAAFAIDAVNKSDAPAHVKRGALMDQRIWGESHAT